MAALSGIDVDRTISLTFVIGAALAAVAGLMFLLYYGVIDFFIGFLAGVKAFTAAVLGGIGSLPGAMLGGILIGLIETMWSAYFSIEYKDVAAFSILIIVLIFLPTGILGRPEVERCERSGDRVPRESEPFKPSVLAAALKQAAIAAAIAFGLFVLMVGIKTDQGPTGALVITTRFGTVGVLVRGVFAGAFLRALFGARIQSVIRLFQFPPGGLLRRISALMCRRCFLRSRSSLRSFFTPLAIVT